MVLVSNAIDESGVKVTLREFRDGEYYYTVCDEKEIAERYTSSCDELKLFDFETTGFRGEEVTGNIMTYTFQDLGLGSVSDYSRYYAYDIAIDTNQLEYIHIYYKEYPRDEVNTKYKITYKLTEYSNTDASVIFIPDHYEMYTNFLGSHYDGEYPPVWWRSEL